MFALLLLRASSDLRRGPLFGRGLRWRCLRRRLRFVRTLRRTRNLGTIKLFSRNQFDAIPCPCANNELGFDSIEFELVVAACLDVNGHGGGVKILPRIATQPTLTERAIE